MFQVRISQYVEDTYSWPHVGTGPLDEYLKASILALAN